MALENEIARPLVELEPQYDFFVGVDSDGCAFDTMEIKHKECFIPNIINYWGLQAVSKYAREAAEFVNLYSKWRGTNRWPALIKVFDLLRERKEVQEREVEIPEANRIREFIASDFPTSNEGLRAYKAENPDPQLDKALAWSEAVNATVADMVHDIPPFPYVRQSLEKLVDHADIIVVSATPNEALNREWKEHGIDAYVQVIAGQEMGTKAEHLEMAAQGKYDSSRILMIGDSPGDMRSARHVNALFFPVNPGQETESWERFYNEALDRFLNETYAGEYEQERIAEFEAMLPKVPPWEK